MQMPKQKAYKKVFELACDALMEKGVEGQALNAGALYRGSEGKGVIELPYFDELFSIAIPEFSFKSSKGAGVNLVSKIIALHYLMAATGEPLQGEQAAYEDIPGGRHYLPVFESRVLKPLTSAFGYHRDAFLESGTALGGKEEEFGDASFTLFAFPGTPYFPSLGRRRRISPVCQDTL